MTYADLLDKLARLVTFDGDNPGDASVSTLQTVIGLAESRIYREIRSSLNEKAWTGTISGGAYALPSDFKQSSAVHFGKYPLQPVSWEYLQEYLQSNDTGDARFFANKGEYLYFAPAVTDGTAVQGTYYYAYPALSETNIASNLLFQDSPDLFIYAAMVEAAPLYGFLDQLQYWEGKYQNARDAVNTENQLNAMGAGRVKVRASTTLMG